MTPNDDRSPGGDSGGPTDTGGFRFGATDGGEPESDARTRTDGAGPTNSRFDFESWLGDSLPGVRGESDPVDEATDTEAASEAATPEFGGFGFGSWLESTDARTPSAAETDATSTDGLESDEAATTTVSPSEFGGFAFGEWLEETESQVSTTAETDAAGADSGYGGFGFGEWLGEDGSEALAPVEVGDEPATERARATAETGVDESPAFPAPQSGGITDAPPVKLAMFALFGATLVVVGLTVGGALAPLGPTDGFSSAAGGGEEAETEPAATATPTSTPTPDPTPDAAPDPTPTPTPTATPTPTPTATPTPTPTATPTPTPTPTSTPTPTPEGTDDGLLDPVFGG
jgi:hypothetical protein